MAPILYLNEANSTNQYLIDLLESEKVDEGTAVACFNQTNGRGQKGNNWFSEPGKNICYSIVIYPDSIVARNQFIISQMVALSVKAFLDGFTTNISIKWPNDIYWNDQKIAGILIENKLTGNFITHSVIGIGININQVSFPSEIPNPVSLKQITGTDYDLKDMINKLHCKIQQSGGNVNGGIEDNIQRFYVNNLYHRDGFYTYRDKEGDFSARIRGISGLGNLILEHEDGTVKDYAFKEVAYIL
jgi:BirA family transcriptional regulator, biotin operon repressor / biotin---[acetyl-CoA-carboxylase] ligase